MSLKKLFLITCAAAGLSGPAFADAPLPPAEERPYPYSPPYVVEPASRIWYAEVHGGTAWPDTVALDSFGDVYVADMDSSWTAGGALGYRYDSGFRSEFEGTWRDNDGLIFDPLLPGVSPARIRALNLMLNGLYDFDTGSLFTPYVGAGAGAAQVRMEFDFPLGTVEDDGWAFAYQAIGGFSVSMPNTAIELFADYRYLRTAGLQLFEGTVQDHDEYAAHSVLGGVLVNF